MKDWRVRASGGEAKGERSETGSQRSEELGDEGDGVSSGERRTPGGVAAGHPVLLRGHRPAGFFAVKRKTAAPTKVGPR
jgi:hypothetical protein